MKTPMLLAIALTVACAGMLSAQTGPEASYTNYTGDDGETQWSPGWVPSQPNGGRHGNGWVETFAICVYQPAPIGGRGVGMGVKQYNSCGFPNNNSLTLDTSDDVPYRWSIFGDLVNRNILWGTLTYYWHATSDCMTASPYDIMNADIVVTEEVNTGFC